MAQYLKKKTFIKVMRGYSPEEVDAYIEYLLTKYNELKKEEEENKRRLTAALNRVQELTETRAAETAPAGLIGEAKEESQRILTEARERAVQILHEAENEARVLVQSRVKDAERAAKEARQAAEEQRKTAEKLYAEVFAFRDKLFSMYNEHIELVESVAEEANAYYDRVTEEVGGEETQWPDHEPENDGESTDPGAGEKSGNADGNASGDGESGESEAPRPESAREKAGFARGLSSLEALASLADESGDVEELSVETETAAPSGEATESGEEEIIPDDLLSDLPEELLEEGEEGELARYLGLVRGTSDEDEDTLDELEALDGLRIDWNRHRSRRLEQDGERRMDSGTDEGDDGLAADLAPDDEMPDRDVAEDSTTDEKGTDGVFTGKQTSGNGKRHDFYDLDDLLASGAKSSGDPSLTDEFNIVYSNRNSSRNVEEISRQPLVTPERPSNPKKHKRR